MNVPLRFRYVNEIVGAFILVACLLVLSGIVVAGRARGWFEGEFSVHTVFSTDEGSFGLKEGDEVRVRNTVAGRVHRIRPTEAGGLLTTFRLMSRFQPFVRTDSLARVKRKFGVAGDSFVEIEMGKEPAIQDGDTITSAKDEVVTETIQKLLAKVEEVGVPMLTEIQEILHGVRGITGDIQSGKGMVGSVLKDETLAHNMRSSAGQMQTLIGETRIAVQETTRLIQGFQKHWLIRRYIPPHPSTRVIPWDLLQEHDRRTLVDHLHGQLREGRLRNDSTAIVEAGTHIIECMLAEHHIDDALILLSEIKREAELLSSYPASVGRVEILTETAQGKPVEHAQIRSLQSLDGNNRINVVLRCILESRLARSTRSIPEMKTALKHLEKTGRYVDDTATDPAVRYRFAFEKAHLYAGLSHTLAAANAMDEASRAVADLDQPTALAALLLLTGDYYQAAGQNETAMHRYFKACRIQTLQEDLEAALKSFAKVRTVASSEMVDRMQTELLTMKPRASLNENPME